MTKKIINFAPNLSRGGGRTLVSSIINYLSPSLKRMVIFYLDERLHSEFFKKKLNVHFIKPSLFGRLLAEYKLYQESSRDTKLVLMLGSLGPLFRLKCKTILFVHNKFLISNISLSNHTFRTKVRIFIERLWLKYSAKNVDIFVVQTESMKNALRVSSISKSKRVEIIPFLEKINNSSPANNKKQNTFVYIASGEPHKNYYNLLQAWEILANDNLFPKLYITLNPKFNKKILKIIKMLNKNLKTKIINVGEVSRPEVFKLYEKSCALIYPSKFESFGIPLIEARSFNLPIIASELDFVRDVADPDESFNPDSPLSISRAVKRFLKKPSTIIKPFPPEKFLKKIMDLS